MQKMSHRLKYKPGYIISIAMNPGADFYNFVMTFKAPNSDNVDEPMICYHKDVLGKKADVDPLTDEQVCELMVEHILNRERHEIKEWLRLDGIKVLDPHS